MEDEEKRNRSRGSITEENTIHNQHLLDGDARYTSDELCIRMLPNYGRSSIQHILHDELDYCKLSGCWVPWLLM